MSRAALLLAAALLGAAGPAPDLASHAGMYYGRIMNSGAMECVVTIFELSGGELRGRYHIAAEEPFDGTLTGFKPDPPGEHPLSGMFTWTDRYGTGVEWLSFAPSGESYVGYWGLKTVSPANQSWGTRRPVKGCDTPVS